jgi:hypothetical protein
MVIIHFITRGSFKSLWWTIRIFKENCGELPMSNTKVAIKKKMHDRGFVQIETKHHWHHVPLNKPEKNKCISKWNFNLTDTFWILWKPNCHALCLKLFIHVSIMCLYFVNTAVSCQLYTSTKLILICFQNIIFEKEVCTPWFSAQMYVFML